MALAAKQPAKRMEFPRSHGDLRHIWDSLFCDEFYKEHSDDQDCQSVYLLIEGASTKIKQLVTVCSDFKSVQAKTIAELEERNKECSKLKNELKNLKNCEKCVELESELRAVKKKSEEAQHRMDSIAKILQLGEQDDASQSQRNSAMTLLSQMLGYSPKRKRRCSRSMFKKDELLIEDKILVPDTSDIQDNVQIAPVAAIPDTVLQSPLKIINNNNLKSPNFLRRKEKKTQSNDVCDIKPSLSTSLDVPSSTKTIAPKRNITTSFISFAKNNFCEDDIIENSPPKKNLSFKLEDPPPLDDTLVNYVKHGQSKLEKIFFGENHSTDDKVSSKCQDVTVIGETPKLTRKTSCKYKTKCWELKQEMGVSKDKTANGNRLKQLKLGVKSQIEDHPLDISTFVADISMPPTGAQEEVDIIESPNTRQKTVNLNLMKQYSNQDMDSCDTTLFKPVATSTQKACLDSSFDRIPNKESYKSPTFPYKREPLRKKAEKMKLDGWDCEECHKYYVSLGKDVNSDEIKERMKACSKHRHKFKPSQHPTPPDFWNPLFPDTQECREKRMYSSIYKPEKTD